MNKSSSRRKFLVQSLQAGAALLGVGLWLSACQKKKFTPEIKSIESCDDFSGVMEAELQKRKQFAYVKQAPDANKTCNSCKLYLPPKAGERCGGCMLFKGPVDANGSCTYWAPLD